MVHGGNRNLEDQTKDGRHATQELNNQRGRLEKGGLTTALEEMEYAVKIFTLKMPTPNIKERTSKEITAFTRAQEVTDTQSRKVTRRDLSDS